MPIPIATVDVSDYGATHFYGIIYEPPTITRSIGSGDAVTGFVEVNDLEWEMFPAESSGALGLLLDKWLRDEYQDHTVKVEFRDVITGLLSTEWIGTIQEDWLVASGGIHLKGAGFPHAALEQRIPKPVITLDDFPGAVDVGKTPPYIIGVAKKLKLLYINDGVGGVYDYMLNLGAGYGSYPSIFRDTVNQGATLPPGSQSFDAVSPGSVTVTGGNVTASGYNYVRVRFTTRQVNSLGALVGVYADFEGDSVSRTSPVEALRTALTHEPDGLAWPNTAVDHASFDAARDKFASLIAPRVMSMDGIIGANNQPVAVADVVKPMLQACNGYLGINTAGKFTLNIDGPPSTIKMSVGAGPLVADNNIAEPGTRKRKGLADRPKRFILDYGWDLATGAYLYQRVKSLQAKGRDITTANAFIRRHLTADMAADRLAKIHRNSQDIVEGTVIASPYAWSLNEGDLIQYTWHPHGCEDELRKVIRVRKELGKVTIDHRAYTANEWDYPPTTLPPDFEAPSNNPPPPPPGPGGTLVEDTGEDRIVCQQLLGGGYTTIKTIGITVDTTGNRLKKWAFVEVCTEGSAFGGTPGTVWAKLRNVTTGQYVEVAKSLYARGDLFPPYIVYFASFPASEVFHEELGLAAGTYSLVLELNMAPAQTLFYGSADILQPGLVSNGYVRAQEWN